MQQAVNIISKAFTYCPPQTAHLLASKPGATPSCESSRKRIVQTLRDSLSRNASILSTYWTGLVQEKIGKQRKSRLGSWFAKVTAKMTGRLMRPPTCPDCGATGGLARLLSDPTRIRAGAALTTLGGRGLVTAELD